MFHLDATTALAAMPLVLRLLSTTQQTRPPSGDETGLLTLCGFSGNGRGFSDMLVVTTTVRMVDRVHGYTTSLGPGVALGGKLFPLSATRQVGINAERCVPCVSLSRP